MFRLVHPQTRYEASYRAYVDELDQAGEVPIPWVLGWDADDFPRLVQRLRDESHPDHVPRDFVPHSTYWLVDEAGELLAVTNLRHRLNASLKAGGGHIGYGVRPRRRGCGLATVALGQTLEKARQLGLPHVVLFCQHDNHASARVMQKQGATRVGTIQHPQHGCLHRYEIVFSDHAGMRQSAL